MLTTLPQIRTIKLFIVLLSIVAFASCSAPGLTNPDNYKRNHDVFAVDFNPSDLSELNIYKMNEGNWETVATVKNGKSARYSINYDGDYLVVSSNQRKMDVPTYKTWLDYARAQLGYDVNSEYDVFDIVEEGWIYEIDLNKHPLVEGEDKHRILMYEIK